MPRYYRDNRFKMPWWYKSKGAEFGRYDVKKLNPPYPKRHGDYLGETWATHKLNAMRDEGYPMALDPRRQGVYDPSQGTIGGMRLPGRTPLPTSYGGWSGAYPGHGTGATTPTGPVTGLGGKGGPGPMAAGGGEPPEDWKGGWGGKGDPDNPPPPSIRGPSVSGLGTGTFGPSFRSSTGGDDIPDPYAQGDYERELGLLSTIPEDLIRQYMGIANRGIYGPEGIAAIERKGIEPARERTEAMTGDIMQMIRAGESQGRSTAARALSNRLGGRYASQPGRMAGAIMSDVVGPSLARESAMAATLTGRQTEMLNRFDMTMGDLMKENMASKTLGLQGMQSVTGQIAGLTGARYKDTSLENKFGWSPERRGEVTERLQRLQAHYNMDTQEMMAYWRYFYQAQLMRLAESFEDDFDWGDLVDLGVDIGKMWATKGEDG